MTTQATVIPNAQATNASDVLRPKKQPSPLAHQGLGTIATYGLGLIAVIICVNFLWTNYLGGKPVETRPLTNNNAPMIDLTGKNAPQRPVSGPQPATDEMINGVLMHCTDARPDGLIRVCFGPGQTPTPHPKP